MTDKHIIDEVNVSECGYYWNGTCHAYVSNSLNCYFKQIKRKEQECEKLKQWKKGAENLFKAQIDNTVKIINRYKQALDEIRQYRVCEINDVDKEEDDVILGIIDEVMEP